VENKKISQVKCPVCGSLNYKTIFEDSLGDNLPSFDYAFTPSHNQTYMIVKCLSCTHGFSIVPRNNFWKNYQITNDKDYLKRQNERLMTAQKVHNLLKKVSASGKLLDVGCATGDFLSVAQNDHDVEGLELSEWSASIARERGFKIHTCRLDELRSDSHYDVITLWGVIEHFESPRKEIQNISRLLKPGGIVCLWTGDFESWTARLLGKRWWYIQGQHIQFFSKKSLCQLFSDFNFDTLSIVRYPFTTDFRSLSKSLGRYKHLNRISHPILASRFLADKTIELSLPGEMCAFFKKK
jgi:ubiquinone/menaquinone biosynthesis C-methylase UbiE